MVRERERWEGREDVLRRSRRKGLRGILVLVSFLFAFGLDLIKEESANDINRSQAA